MFESFKGSKSPEVENKNLGIKINPELIGILNATGNPDSVKTEIVQKADGKFAIEKKTIDVSNPGNVQVETIAIDAVMAEKIDSILARMQSILEEEDNEESVEGITEETEFDRELEPKPVDPKLLQVIKIRTALKQL